MSIIVTEIVNLLYSVMALMNGLMANWVAPGTVALTDSGSSFVSSIAYLVQNTVYFLNQLLIALMA